MFVRRWFVILFASFVAASALAPSVLLGDELSPEAFLRRKGLSPFGRSDVWLVRDEILVHRRLKSFPALKAAIQQSELALDNQIVENRNGWLQVTQMEAALNSLPSSVPADALQRRQLQQRLHSLRQKFAEPQQLGGVPAVQLQLIELINARNTLGLSILWLRTAIAGLTDRYEKLHRDEKVLDALQQLGGANHLGPLVDSDRVFATLAEYENIAFTSTLPLYLQSGQLRFSGILNEDTPVTFTWIEYNDRTIITTNMAQLAGIDVPPDAPRAELTFGNRRLTAASVQVPYLRFGTHVIRDAQVCVLPAEGEQIGAQIGRTAFGILPVEVRPELLSITFGGEKQ